MAAPAIVKFGSLSYTTIRALCSTGLGPPNICWAFNPVADAIVGSLTLGTVLERVFSSDDAPRSAETATPMATFTPFPHGTPPTAVDPTFTWSPTSETAYATVTTTVAPTAAKTPQMEPASIALLVLNTLAILILALNSRPWAARG